MVIEGRVQYLLAITCLVPTRKLASQFLPLALRLLTTHRVLTPLQGQVRRLTTHRVLTPLMFIEGWVQYLLAIARLVPTRKLSQSIYTFGTRTYGYGGFHSRPSSPSKSWTSQSQSYTSGTPSHYFLSLSPCSNTTETDSRLESPHVLSKTPTYSLTHAAFSLLLPLRLICH
jgi:hypothetical protein